MKAEDEITIAVLGTFLKTKYGKRYDVGRMLEDVMKDQFPYMEKEERTEFFGKMADAEKRASIVMKEFEVGLNA